MGKLRIALLGATGSIGRQTLRVIAHNREEFELVAASVGSDDQALAVIYQGFQPKYLGIADETHADSLVALTGCKNIFAGGRCNNEICMLDDVDAVVIALTGMQAVYPLFTAIAQHKRICLANKECIVCAGELVEHELKKSGGIIYPIDSEQSAIFQCLQACNRDQLDSLILTASGGPFRDKRLEQLQNVTVDEALNHPSWSMGKKISIDSATLVNKGLEVIEAKFLFGVEKAQIRVWIHPQSIVHSMIELSDGAVLAQLGSADMQLPIQYALTCPERLPSPARRLNISQMAKLEFFEPDLNRFIGLKLAYDALDLGGTATAVYNAANEVAVELFLQEKIEFLKITDIIDATLGAIEAQKLDHIQTAIDADKKAREFVYKTFGN